MPSRKLKLLLAAVSILAGLLMVEAALRMGLPANSPLRPRSFFLHVPDIEPVEIPGFPYRRGEETSDPRIKSELWPDVTFEQRYDAGHATQHPYMRVEGGWLALDVTLNEAAMRGDAPALAKPEGSRRIACVGDSFTFGDGVMVEDCWTFNLGADLGPKPIDVVNFGVPGYDSSDVLASIEANALAYDPNLVIWAVVLNDPPAAGDQRLAALGQGATDSLTASNAPLEGLAKHSRIAAMVENSRRQKQLAQDYHDFVRGHFATGSQSWAAFEADLARIKQTLDAAEVPLLVVIFPMLNGLDGDYPFAQQHAQIAAACNDLAIPNLDLAPAFAGNRPESLWVHPADQHPNPMGHAIAKTAIRDYLAQHLPSLMP